MHYTPLYIAAHGARTCWESHDKSDNGGPADCSLIDRVGNKFKHKSILEHVSYNFFIEGISRALLQELARHRMASYSVKSTRYTLKELKEEPYIFNTSPAGCDPHWSIVKKYCVLTGNNDVDLAIANALSDLKCLIDDGISNDIAKYALPEAYKTTVQWTINIRSLQNFLALRTDKSALWEIRDLAHAVYDALPIDHQFLFTDYVYQPD
jgi:thymidylate synthase (FAD)